MGSFALMPYRALTDSNEKDGLASIVVILDKPKSYGCVQERS